MWATSFEEIIRLQFQSLMMITIKGTVKQCKKRLAKRSEHECSLCYLAQNRFSAKKVFDCPSYSNTTFKVLNFSIPVSNENIELALCQLSEKYRNYLLLYYFQGFSDREISELYHVSRSSIGYIRNRGLDKMRALLNER